MSAYPELASFLDELAAASGVAPGAVQTIESLFACAEEIAYADGTCPCCSARALADLDSFRKIVRRKATVLDRARALKEFVASTPDLPNHRS